MTEVQPVEKKYSELTPGFFKKPMKNQINIVRKHPEKTAEFKKAVETGDCKFTEKLTKKQYEWVGEMGISVPPEFRPEMTETVKNARLSKRQVQRLWMEFGYKAPEAMLPIKKTRKPKAPKVPAA